MSDSEAGDTANGERAAVESVVDGPLGVITLTQARRRNPLSSAVMREISAALTGITTSSAPSLLSLASSTGW